jgi:hypothetical protein
MEGLKKTAKVVSQASRSAGQDLKLATCEYEAGMIPL